MSPDPSDPEDEVRRVLADLARDDRPSTMPPPVAARLDDVIHDLATDRARRPTRDQPPGDRATGRTSSRPAPQRRRWPQVLVAAAAVVVVAGAGAAVLTRGVSGGDGGSTSASKAGSADSRAGADRQGAAPEPSPSGSGGGGRALAPSGAPQPRLRTPTLADDVQRVADHPPTPAPPRNDDCARPSVPAGAVVVAVRLDGRAATLVLPAVGATGEARVYSCDRAVRPVATTTVRKP